MRLKIVQIGEKPLRQHARPLTSEEIQSAAIQQLIEFMRDTMRDAPGVGLAAPQIGLPLQIAVIEDRPEYVKDVAPELIAERERSPVSFHVAINPQIHIDDPTPIEFFEGCLSLSGFVALTPRAAAVRVVCLNEHGKPTIIRARGWYARILQHEIDHLNGILYIDRMHSRSLMTADNYARHWKDKTIERVRSELGIV